MFYTYISRKQIGVVFANAKRGNINLSEDVISWLYKNCAEVRGYNNNNNFEDVLRRVKSGIDSIFSGNYAEAEEVVIGAYNLYNAIFA